MPALTRPTKLTRWATGGGATVTEPTEGKKDSGHVADEEASPGEFNWRGRQAYTWEQHLDQSRPGLELMGTTSTKVGLHYTVSAGLTSKPLSAGTAWVDGRRHDYPAARLTAMNENVHTFTASKDTYLAVSEDGEDFEHNEVANEAAAPTPSSGYTNVEKIITDATDVTASTSLLVEEPALEPHRTVGLTRQTGTSVRKTEAVAAGEVTGTSYVAIGSIDPFDADGQGAVVKATFFGMVDGDETENYTESVVAVFRRTGGSIVRDGSPVTTDKIDNATTPPASPTLDVGAGVIQLQGQGTAGVKWNWAAEYTVTVRE